MEAVGGVPGDGEEIEAVLRRFFGSLSEPVADVTVGKLREVAELLDAEAPKLPWELYDLEQRVKRVGVATIQGDEATVEFSATQAPTRGPAGTVESSEVMTFDRPSLVRTDGCWKLADYYVDGIRATDAIHRLDARKASRGITVELLLARSWGRTQILHLRITNARDAPVWLADAGAYRPPAGFHPGARKRWMTVGPGETDVTAFSWTGRFRPFRSKVRLYLPFFDVGRRRWLRVGIAGRIHG